MKNESRDIALEQQIDAYIKGKLSQEKVNGLWVELLKKPEYISLLQTEIDVARVHQARQKEQNSNTYYWKWIAATAAVVLLVLSINFWGGHSTKSIQQWATGSISLADNLATTPVRRSAAETDPSDSMLNAGYKAAVSGKTDEAMRIFNTILTKFDDPRVIAKAHLNLGILRYNSGNFSKSIDDFKSTITYAQNQDIVTEKAYWYMGNAYINTGELENARNAVQQAYSCGNIYKAEALKLLKRLDYELGKIDYDEFEQQMQQD